MTESANGDTRRNGTETAANTTSHPSTGASGEWWSFPSISMIEYGSRKLLSVPLIFPPSGEGGTDYLISKGGHGPATGLMAAATFSRPKAIVIGRSIIAWAKDAGASAASHSNASAASADTGEQSCLQNSFERAFSQTLRDIGEGRDAEFAWRFLGHEEDLKSNPWCFIIDLKTDHNLPARELLFEYSSGKQYGEQVLSTLQMEERFRHATLIKNWKP